MTTTPEYAAFTLDRNGHAAHSARNAIHFAVDGVARCGKAVAEPIPHLPDPSLVVTCRKCLGR